MANLDSSKERKPEPRSGFFVPNGLLYAIAGTLLTMIFYSVVMLWNMGYAVRASTEENQNHEKRIERLEATVAQMDVLAEEIAELKASLDRDGAKLDQLLENANDPQREQKP